MWQKTKNIYHLNQAIVANILYGFPSRGMKIIGVTGTEGKTTTSNLIYHVLKKAGKKVAVISTIGAIIDGEEFDTGYHITTPEHFALQSYLKRAKKQKVEYLVLEVTSHALDQHRAFGVKLVISVVTNIANDHLDYHKTWENYVHAKAKLLKAAKIAVVNKDDRSYQRLKKYELKNRNKEIVTFGFKKDSDINPHVFPFQTKLFGQFNKYNCLAAIAVARELHIPDETIRKGILSFKAPTGRQETVYDKEFKVIIDFATTEYSYRSLLPIMRKLATKRLIHVFGSAGLRDFAKRPILGRITSEYSDIIVLTAEDPRKEGAEKISNEIASGIKGFEIVESENVESVMSNLQKNKKYVFKIPNRKDAIEFAISLAQKGDLILITGKGHERSMNYGNGEEAWSEHDTVKKALEMRGMK